MAEKYYAVRKGCATGIFRTWDECKASVHGYPSAEYKSFKTEAEALSYLERGQSNNNESKNLVNASRQLSKAVEDVEKLSKEIDGVNIYVDGSYNSATKEFSYGMVVLRNGEEETYNKKFDDKELAAMNNVAGEIKGAEAAMQYALDYKLPRITIFHDYEGIARWCLGDWKTNKDGTKAYKAFYDMASKSVNIKFSKVTGHSNDKYNDMADELAKEALGIL